MKNLFTPPKQVEGTLVGVDGNAFALMARFQRLAKRQHWSDVDIDLVIDKCYEGDYQELISNLKAHMTMK